ncbi:MAG: site-specific DNA-methyltransferase [Desulfobacterales bacterium]|nr:site-specific DNA-methyltransferase [Desulfobacterales bacterium]MBF0398769.1 site-specific DNA-methyltransferase [Desulfobacterales bacterium]
MESIHKIIIDDSRKLNSIENDSIDLIVTSPPYPMIEMWDETFSKLNPSIGQTLRNNDGKKSFLADMYH